MPVQRFFTPILLLSSILLLALNLWGLGPWILEQAGPGFGNLFYVALRVLIIVGVPTLLSWKKGYTSRKAMAASLLVAGVDQIFFKMVLYYQDSLSHPEAWPGDSLKNAALATVASFVLFSPMLLVMGFAGHFAGTQIGKKPKTL